MLDWKVEIRRRLGPRGLPPQREAEVVEELAEHLEAQFQDLCARGATAEDASRAVAADLDRGGSLARALRGALPSSQPRAPALGAGSRVGALARLRGDLRYGLRSLRSRPGLTAAAALTLALAIGANTAIFCLVRGVLLRPLPFRDPERLATFWLSAPDKGLERVPLTHALFSFYRDQSRIFSELAAHAGEHFTLTGEGEPERLLGAHVTHGFFAVLGWEPLHGRSFLAAEDTPGSSLVAVLSDRLWQRRFGGDPDVVGRTITLDGIPTVVVGIMPPGRSFPGESELWVPLGLDPERSNYWYLAPLGRLRPGATVAEAEAEIAALTDEFKRRHPEQFPGEPPGGSLAVAMPLAERLVGGVRRPLLVLMGAVGLVLLVGCANVANLLLARMSTAGRDLAVRRCLGAGRGRIVAQAMVESLVLAIAGALGGLLIASWAVRSLGRLPAVGLPRLAEVRLDPAVLLFAMGAMLLAALLFGLGPALAALSVNPAEALKAGTRGTAPGAHRRLRGAFVVSQLALSVTLLVGAGLLLRSFRELLAVRPGFRTESLLLARLSLPWSRYADGAQVQSFQARLLEELRGLPGVRAVALASHVPLGAGNLQDEFVVEGSEPAAGEPVPVANLRQVSPAYFEAIGTPILAGRPFAGTDAAEAPPVAIVDEQLAARYWPAGEGIGKRVRIGRREGTNPWRTVVGVAASVRHAGLDEDPSLSLYEPLAQDPRWTVYVVVHAAGAPEPLAAAVRRRLATLDPALPLYGVETMEQALDRSLATRRLTHSLVSFFALAALLLATLGIYGVMSVDVGARVPEIGLRLALGAQPREVLRQVLRRGLSLAMAGVGLGLAGALSLSRFLGSLLFGVDALDPLTYAVVVSSLVAAALAACYLPARRASTGDPVAALRSE